MSSIFLPRRADGIGPELVSGIRPKEGSGLAAYFWRGTEGDISGRTTVRRKLTYGVWVVRARAQWLFDIALAVCATALMLGASIAEAHPAAHATAGQIRWLDAHQPGGAYALVVISGLSLAFRRRWPLGVLTVTVVMTAAYSAAGYVPGGALVAVYVALFTVGTTESRPVVFTAALASMVLLFVTAGAGSPFGWLGGTNTVMVACCVASVAIGLAVAGRHQVFAAMVERAERAERDREEEARRRVDAERLRIARELHDIVAHSMSMINVQAGVAGHVLATQPEQAAEALTAIKEASREGLRELRAILNVLRQVDAEEWSRGPAPRLAQLDALVAASTQAGLRTVLTVTGDRAGVSPAMESAVYRIVQESLTNVMRHAGTDVHATVRVDIGTAAIVVTVDDDGRGPASVEFRDGSSAGIAGMRERTTAFGGTLEAGPRPGGGWRVRAELPLSPSGSAVESRVVGGQP
jgi:signal transduction histidine kinase